MSFHIKYYQNKYIQSYITILVPVRETVVAAVASIVVALLVVVKVIAVVVSEPMLNSLAWFQAQTILQSNKVKFLVNLNQSITNSQCNCPCN